MSLSSRIKRLFGRDKIVVDAHELEALRRENAEAGRPTLERTDVDRDLAMPRTWNLPAWMWGQRRSNGSYSKVVGAGNPISNNEVENLNRRYAESAWKEEHLRDD
jgi:hypothetical protein